MRAALLHLGCSSRVSRLLVERVGAVAPRLAYVRQVPASVLACISTRCFPCIWAKHNLRRRLLICTTYKETSGVLLALAEFSRDSRTHHQRPISVTISKCFALCSALISIPFHSTFHGMFLAGCSFSRFRVSARVARQKLPPPISNGTDVSVDTHAHARAHAGGIKRTFENGDWRTVGQAKKGTSEEGTPRSRGTWIDNSNYRRACLCRRTSVSVCILDILDNRRSRFRVLACTRLSRSVEHFVCSITPRIY